MLRVHRSTAVTHRTVRVLIFRVSHLSETIDHPGYEILAFGVIGARTSLTGFTLDSTHHCRGILPLPVIELPYGPNCSVCCYVVARGRAFAVGEILYYRARSGL